MRILIALVIGTLALGQAQRPTFEVATVKPTKISGPVNSPPGRYIATGSPLKALIGYAYAMRDFQIFGGPNWISTDLWEIQAKIPDGVVIPRPSTMEEFEKALATPGPDKLMLQSLLEERFQLRIRRETRELPIYELTVASGGLKMTLAADQSPLVFGPLPELSPGGRPALIRGSLGIRSSPDRRVMEAKAIPLSQLVLSVLMREVGRPVIDRTGLKGLYDMKLEWTPENLQAGAQNGLLAAPLLTTALQEQLGLRLESTRGPVEVLVVESAEKPSEN